MNNMLYTKAEAQVVAALKRSRQGRSIQSFERQFNTADPGGSPAPVSMGSNGSDFFVDQFSVNVFAVYFTVAAGVYTNIAAAALNATLKTKLATFIFGSADFGAGFSKGRSMLNGINIWLYGLPFVYGGQGNPSTVFGALDATALAFLQLGDLVQPFTAIVAGPVNTVGLMVTRLNNGYYGNLLKALDSDVFTINKVRYQLTLATDTAQFSNTIQLINQSWFGAAKTDNIDATTNKTPTQFQAGIIDVPVRQTFYKAIGWATYFNYDCQGVTFSFFVDNTQKIRG